MLLQFAKGTLAFYNDKKSTAVCIHNNKRSDNKQKENIDDLFYHVANYGIISN